MALNLGSTVAQVGHEFPVLIARAKGNAFYAKPIKGREGFNALVGNIEAGKPVMVELPTQDGETVEVDINTLTATIVISDDDLEQLQEAPGNAYLMSSTFVVSLNDRVAPESPLYGSIWAEPLADLNALPAPGRVTSAKSAKDAIEAAKARRQTRIRELGSKVVAEGMQEPAKVKA